LVCFVAASWLRILVIQSAGTSRSPGVLLEPRCCVLIDSYYFFLANAGKTIRPSYLVNIGVADDKRRKMATLKECLLGVMLLISTCKYKNCCFIKKKKKTLYGIVIDKHYVCSLFFGCLKVNIPTTISVNLLNNFFFKIMAHKP